jgi:hypothetical protein
MPVVKLGHHRFTPPNRENQTCNDCFVHPNDPLKAPGATAKLNTMYVAYRNGQVKQFPRLHTLVADHTVISFLTDSFDKALGYPYTDAMILTDQFKVRNHVELHSVNREVTGHLELISEPQTESKNYSGIYTRHLHMEPVAPSCSEYRYSQLWTGEPTLEVIATSTLGGYGWIHSDIYAEIAAVTAPGFASLETTGTCVEQQAGILKVKDFRADAGARLKVSLGDYPSEYAEDYEVNGVTYKLGEYSDLLDVDSLTLRGTFYVDLVIRPEGLSLVPGTEQRFPILKYRAVGQDNANNIHLANELVSAADHPSINGIYRLSVEHDQESHIVSLRVATDPIVPLVHFVYISEADGVVNYIPRQGKHFAVIHSNFNFRLAFNTEQPLAVYSDRVIFDQPEGELIGTLNQNGEYEYVIENVTSDVVITIGPNFAGMPPLNNDNVQDYNVWAHNNILYIKVDKNDIANVYSVTGSVVKQVLIEQGITTTQLQQGVYIVKLKNGKVHKIVIK